MTKEYKVMLDVTLLETIFIEADSKEEAVEEAIRTSNFVAEGGTAELFEVSEVKS